MLIRSENEHGTPVLKVGIFDSFSIASGHLSWRLYPELAKIVGHW